jgi:hypothetical protein
MALKKALVERVLGAELSHHPGYASGAERPADAKVTSRGPVEHASATSGGRSMFGKYVHASHRISRALVFVPVCCVLLFTAGCASVFYSRTATGTFSGKLTVEWVQPNLFIYRPDKDDPLQFTTPEGRRIQPQLMYTDGGSIPRLFWSAPDFGPWDFAPGYVIHDWLFQQHHCQTGDWRSYDFPKSAEILAQGIKTQMEKAGKPEPTVVWAIYEAVSSPIAENLWTKGSCVEPVRLESKGTPSNPIVLLKVEAK